VDLSERARFHHFLGCRDALALLLKECPNITGVTFRIHVESGIPEGSYDFWKTVFDGCVQSVRRVAIDLHAKGIDQPMIDVVLGTGLPVTISPKFWEEHPEWREQLPGNPPVTQAGFISMCFNSPYLDYLCRQIAEAVLLHRKATAAEARRLTVEMLRQVGIPTAELCFDQYPHELSGGMRQRVVIAMALVCRPELLIADEPTTALDVTIQAQILGLIKTLQRGLGCSVLLITHDFGVVAQVADDVAVMHHGKIVEHGTVRAVLKNPQHAYTRALLDALPSRRARVA